MKMRSSAIFSQKVYIEAIHGACNRRLLDAQKIASYFEKNGCKIVEKAGDADILFLITCGVSLERESSSIRRIHALKKLRRKLIVGGCLPAINRQMMMTIYNGMSIPTSELNKIDDCFGDKVQVKFSELGDANRYYKPSTEVLGPNFLHVVIAKLTSLSRLPLQYTLRKEIPRLIGNVFSRRNGLGQPPYSIRVSWGCSHKCTYCGIRSAVGELHSKPLEICLEEFRTGLNNGYTEFELIGDDVGAYGLDMGKTFPDLLNALSTSRGNYTMQIWNLSPVWFIKSQETFITILKQGRISGIHYPVQSGSSKLLKAMRRYSNTDKIKESVRLMKECHKDLIVTTDIIVGYPGETDDDITATVDLLCTVRFDSVHIFLYNEVPTADSYTIHPKTPRNIAIQRVDRIERELSHSGIDSLVMV
jgi:tRNA A37 methylthiotransferase MiaB